MSRLVELKQQKKDLTQKLFSLKTKPAQAKVVEQIRSVKEEIYNILDEFASQLNNKIVQLEVVWFDSSSFEGLAKFEIGNTTINAFFYSCNDAKSKSWYPELSCVKYTNGQKIKATLDVDADSEGLNISLKNISGGKIDHAQYRSLCKNKNLAFFKYPKATGVTGLFKAV